MFFLLAQATAGPESLSYGWMFAKMVMAMLFILSLALITIKYILPKVVKLRRNSRSSIEILDYQHLEPRKSVYVVKIEDKKVAIAVSENSVAKLCEWDTKSAS